jgi:hypothetical protein
MLAYNLLPIRKLGIGIFTRFLTDANPAAWRATESAREPAALQA